MRKNQTITEFFSMILLLTLSVGFFGIVLFDFAGYQTLIAANEKVERSHLPYAYLLQKMRSAEKIDVEQNEVIIRNGNVETYIYFYEGDLCELNLSGNENVDRKYGEPLFKLDDFSVSKNQEHVMITYHMDEQEKNVVYAFRGSQYE